MIGLATHAHAQSIDPALRRRLIRMYVSDQRSRARGIVHAARDARRTDALKAIIAMYDWPGACLVGEDAAMAAWTIVQHSDHDLAFQKLCLRLIQHAQTHGDMTGVHVALLTDRILVAEGKPQLYGSQLKMDARTGRLAAENVADPKQLDVRRRSVGLEPWEEYRRWLESISRTSKR